MDLIRSFLSPPPPTLINICDGYVIHIGSEQSEAFSLGGKHIVIQPLTFSLPYMTEISVVIRQ